jgi:hypothetical protein
MLITATAEIARFMVCLRPLFARGSGVGVSWINRGSR